MKLLLLLTGIASTFSFQVAPARPNAPTKLAIAQAPLPQTMPKHSFRLEATAIEEDVSTEIASKMDERLFGFNKLVIDTVYDLICLIYPVTGGDRDYARFFVLETVAR